MTFKKHVEYYISQKKKKNALRSIKPCIPKGIFRIIGSSAPFYT